LTVFDPYIQEYIILNSHFDIYIFTVLTIYSLILRHKN